jgi:hypothetical protein
MRVLADTWKYWGILGTHRDPYLRILTDTCGHFRNGSFESELVEKALVHWSYKQNGTFESEIVEKTWAYKQKYLRIVADTYRKLGNQAKF